MSRDKKQKVFVAMSGGVDSSVAALLLRDAGYDVTGVFMRCYNIDGCAERDAVDARRVAASLGIPFYVFDFEEEYKRRVVEYMVEGYRKGITPNPDVMCNKEIKFGLFLKKALSLGADYVATGHYVRFGYSASRKQHNFLPARKFASLSPRNSSLRSETELSGLRDVPQGRISSPLSLFVAKDENKDQSYFLWTLTQEQLKHCLFPIGDYVKSEVREMARKAGLPTAKKKDSQGICFLGKVSLRDFLKNYIPVEKGRVLTMAGEKVGEHEGAEFYTIGQRHVGVGGLVKPHYVVAKDVKTNTIVVAEGSDNPALYSKEVKISNLNFINPDFKEGEILARVRYRQPLFGAKLRKLSSTIYNLKFDRPVKFVAPGQSAVFYSKEGEMLGGGIIK